jgi:hypothetical protein
MITPSARVNEVIYGDIGESVLVKNGAGVVAVQWSQRPRLALLLMPCADAAVGRDSV